MNSKLIVTEFLYSVKPNHYKLKIPLLSKQLRAIQSAKQFHSTSVPFAASRSSGTGSSKSDGAKTETEVATISRNRQITLPPRHSKTGDTAVDVQQLLTDSKRGRGGRSSFSGLVVTVFGASRFLGRSVVNRLGKIGSQVIIATNGEPAYFRDFKLAGDLGQVLYMPYHLRDEDSVKRAMEHSNVCINMVGGIRNARSSLSNFTPEDVHVKGAQLIARCARQMGVQRMVHVSALNATTDPPKILTSHGSDFLRCKALGEQAVRAEFPQATIFRPADMWGECDNYLSHYINLRRRNLGGSICVWNRGRDTIKQPVWFSNVGEGIINSITYPGCEGQTYECVGPYRYLLCDLIDYMYQCAQWFDPHIHLSHFNPIFLSRIALRQRMSKRPLLTIDRLETESVTDRLSVGALTLESLGVRTTRIEDRWEWELRPYRKYSYYSSYVGEFPDPVPPKAIGDLASHREEVERAGRETAGTLPTFANTSTSIL